MTAYIDEKVSPFKCYLYDKTVAEITAQNSAYPKAATGDDKFIYERQDCNSKVYVHCGWTPVRNIEKGASKWHDFTDFLAGTATATA